MDFIKQISSFIILLLLQIIVFNNFMFMGYLNPYVYILFIIMLPMNYSRTAVLLLAFAMGACVDIFENSGGVHTAATVFLAFVRRPLLQLSTQKRGIDFESLRIGKLPFSSFAPYAMLAVFVHHFMLFLIESYQLSDIGHVFIRTLASSLFTFVFIFLIHLWNFKKKD